MILLVVVYFEIALASFARVREILAVTSGSRKRSVFATPSSLFYYERGRAASPDGKSNKYTRKAFRK